MSDTEAVGDGVDIDYQEGSEDDARRVRRRRGLVAVIVLLILLLCSCATVSQVWMSGEREQARFVARNIECLQCHTELIPDFSKPAVHDPFAEQKCTKCHTPHGKKVTVSSVLAAKEVLSRTQVMLQWLPFKWFFALTGGDSGTSRSTTSAGSVPKSRSSEEIESGDSVLVMPENELCWSCHEDARDMLGDEYLHQPFAAGRCLNCHSPHASKYASLLVMGPTKLCFTCHPLGDQLQRMQTHPPAKEGHCIKCHDPHASNHQGIIVKAQRDLCVSCHPSVGLKADLAIQHVPFLNGSCTGCHQPHGSKYEPLLNLVRPDLCYECHEDVEPDFRRPSHHPVAGAFMCTSCHDPHAAQYMNLVSATGNDLCYQCHTAVRTVFAKSGHATVRCDKCHKAHGSNNVPLLVKQNPKLCFTCHPRKGYDERTHAILFNNHPVRRAHYDVNAESSLSCTSSCHNPHGTQLRRMLRYFDEDRDGTCLMCHAVTEGSRVGIDY